MTLGRTASGAIKIKTDGGTTRAVECACCGGCPCNYGGSKKLKFENLIGAQITGDHQYFCDQTGFAAYYILQAPISTGGLLVLNIVCFNGQKEILIGATSTDPSVSCGYSTAFQLSGANPEYPLLGTWTTAPDMCGYYEPCEEDTDTGCWVSVDCGSVGCIDITVDIVESND